LSESSNRDLVEGSFSIVREKSERNLLLDTTGDGKIDSVAVDTTGDGIPDKVLALPSPPPSVIPASASVSSDRVTAHLSAKTIQAAIRMRKLGPTSHGGTPVNPVHVHVDTTGDGQVDSVAVDTTGDGVPDRLFAIPEPPTHSRRAAHSGAETCAAPACSAPDVFLSYRISETSAEVRTLRAALQARGLVVFVSEADVGIGDNLHGSIAHALDSCTLFVPVASQTYGANSSTACGTMHELLMAIEERKPLYVIKCCERWSEPQVRLAIGNHLVYTRWDPGTPMPPNLVDEIVAKVGAVRDDSEESQELQARPSQTEDFEYGRAGWSLPSSARTSLASVAEHDEHRRSSLASVGEDDDADQK